MTQTRTPNADNLELVQELLFNGPAGDGTNASFTDGSVPSCTYSGADVKLVVHLPSDEASVAIREMQTLYAENQTFWDEQARASTPAARRNQLQQGISTNIERITELMNEVEAAGPVTKELAELQTLSISIYREKMPVRVLGSVYPRSYTRGSRTIGGSMIFTVFHHHVFQELIEASAYRSTGVGDWDRHRWTTHIADQLPPLDISVRFANEYGNLSWMALFGVEFINEGMVMSSEDILIEGTNTWVARDIDLIRNVANRPLRRNFGVGQQLTGNQLLQENYETRMRGRRYPYI